MFYEHAYINKTFEESNSAENRLTEKEETLRQLISDYNYDPLDPVVYVDSIRRVYKPDFSYKEPPEDSDHGIELSDYEFTDEEEDFEDGYDIS